MFEQEVQLYFMNDEHCPMNKRKFREEFCSFFSANISHWKFAIQFVLLLFDKTNVTSCEINNKY